MERYDDPDQISESLIRNNNDAAIINVDDEKKQYDEDIVQQLTDMGVATKDEIIYASKQTINYKNINDVLDTINKIKDKQSYFKLNWKHIICAIKQELNENTASIIKKIIDKNNIKHTPDNKSSKILLKIINDKKKFTSKQINYIKGLIQRAIQFNPSVVNTPNINKANVNNESFTQTFKYSYDFDDNGLLYYLHQKYYGEVDKPYRIKSSKLSEGSAELEYLIDAPIKWMIKTEKTKKQSFIGIHLHATKIKLSRFALNEYAFDVEKCDVSFQASYDGKNWITVKIFDDDKNKIYSWTVNPNLYFSYFRFFCTPKDKFAGVLEFNLQCCGLELYGDVVTMDQDIFDVFRSYKFSNYHLKNITINDVKSICKLTEFNFYPYYVIEDDIFKVMNYLFYVSYYIKIHNNQLLNKQYTVKTYIK
eukprot:325002_1